MKLYGRTTSFNVQKVLWLLEELLVDYEHTQLGGRFCGLNQAHFAALNPMKKVPVLVDGDKVIWESHSILRYLAASYGNDQFYSNCPYQRSQYERWMDWSQTCFQPAFMQTFWGFYRTPEHKRDLDAVNSALKTCAVCLQIIEDQLSQRRYLSSEALSLADIAVGSILYRLTSQGLQIELPDKVSFWYAELQEQPGYRKWIMSDYSELKGREAF